MFCLHCSQVEQEEKNLPENVTLTCVGILKIDDIDLELPVWNESSRIALRYGLGLYEQSVLPGEVGNSTILGHRNQHTSTMFYRLRKLKQVMLSGSRKQTERSLFSPSMK